MTEAKNLVDILASIRNRRRAGNKTDLRSSFAGKIIKAYLKEVKETVYNGYEFQLPSDFGTAYIKQSDRKRYLRRKGDTSATELKDYNIKRAGKTYKFVIEGGFMKKMGYKLNVTHRDKNRLGSILCNTNIEYRTSLAKT